MTIKYVSEENGYRGNGAFNIYRTLEHEVLAHLAKLVTEKVVCIHSVGVLEDHREASIRGAALRVSFPTAKMTVATVNYGARRFGRQGFHRTSVVSLCVSKAC